VQNAISNIAICLVAQRFDGAAEVRGDRSNVAIGGRVLTKMVE